MQRALRLTVSALAFATAFSGCGGEAEDTPSHGSPGVVGAGIGDAMVIVSADGGNASGTGTDSGGPAGAVSSDAAIGSPRDAGGATSDTGSPRDAGASPPDDGSGAGGGGAVSELPKFSFFVTSLNAIRSLAKSPDGFGGDLRFGEQGEDAGLRGADKICATIAEMSMPGSTAKQWRAFLSTTTVHARTRIGSGPWYDRMGRLIAQNLTDLLQDRPAGAEAVIRDDLPNELGVPNHEGSAEDGNDDNHDTVTATNASGDYDGSNTCADWTSTTAMPSGTGGGDILGGLFGMNGPTVGHSWPAFSGTSWIATHRAPGCSPSVGLVETGPGFGTGIGNGGGYGGIYCFALAP
jgi:hypothetical protein